MSWFTDRELHKLERARDRAYAKAARRLAGGYPVTAQVLFECSDEADRRIREILRQRESKREAGESCSRTEPL